MKRLWHNLILIITRSYARGVWMPLICAFGICLVTLGFLFFISCVTCSGVSLWQIVELMLDPGKFSSATGSVLFQLIITLFGAIVFTSLLITTISNMFSNQAEGYRNGETDIDLDHHTLILGTNSIFYNSLEFLLSHKGEKVILTTKKVKEVRAKIASYVGSDKADEFIILSGDRRFVRNLKRASYDNASHIYILGEDNEKDHDAANISCLRELCKAHNSKIEAECLIEIDNPDVLLLFSQTRLDLNGLKLRCFNRDELIADMLMIKDPNGLKLKPLRAEDEISQHLILIGSSSLSTEIAKLYLKLAHYPNFATKGKRSKLTIIDNNDCINLGLQTNLKDVCHIYEYGNGSIARDTFKGTEYDDLLDFEIRHIKGNILDKNVRNLLESFEYSRDYISIVITSGDTDQNLRDSISLPGYIYEKDYPVFVYQPQTGLLIDKINLPYYYDNLNQFGLNISLQNVYENTQTDIIRAVSNADLMIGVIQSDVKFSDSVIDEHFMNSKIKDQRKKINQAQYIQYMINASGHEIKIDKELLQGLHYSWMATSLLSVYRMMPRNLWNTYTRKLSDPNDNDARIGLMGSRELSHQLYYLTSYDAVGEYVKEYDTEFVGHVYDYLSKRAE